MHRDLGHYEWQLLRDSLMVQSIKERCEKLRRRMAQHVQEVRTLTREVQQTTLSKEIHESTYQIINQCVPKG